MSAVKCSIVFGKPVAGIISHQGFALEHKGKDVLTYLDTNLYYEKNSRALMLRPDLELKSMGGTSPNFTDGDGKAVTTTIGTFELVTMPGQPELKLLHQKDVMADSWTIKSTSTFGINQGFVCYFNKYALDSSLTDKQGLSFSIYGSSNTLAIFIDNKNSVTVSYVHPVILPFVGTIFPSQGVIKDIPANFQMKENTEITSLSVFVVDNKVILGINGIENTLCFELSSYDFEEDANGVSYPALIDENSYFQLSGSGAGVFGFKRLKYVTDSKGKSYGDLVSPWFMPGCCPSDSVTAKITKSIQPEGTSITGYFHGKPIEVEGAAGSGEETGRIRYGFTLRGDGNTTPYVYSWRVKDPQTRISAAGGTQTLTGDVMQYTENIIGNKDGSFGDWRSSLDINCYGAIGAGWEDGIYQNIFTSRNAQVALSFDPGDGAVLRATHFVDLATVGRPGHNLINLTVDAQSIVKRLKLAPVDRAESFDDRGWRHGDLMSYYATLGGVTILNKDGNPLSAADYADDPILPASQENARANWQPNPNDTLWNAMLMLREYSGWLLYPNNSTSLIYKPFPTSADSADWTLNMEAFPETRYAVTDLARTRFMVTGQAGADRVGLYKKGDGIMSYRTNAELEELIGESRKLRYSDPALSSIEMTDNTCRKFHDYYTRIHKMALIKIANFQTYKTMQLYQILDIADPKVIDVDGKYLVIGLRIMSDPFLMSAFLEAMSL